MATKEQIEELKNFCHQKRIVQLETRYGDGRNWDNSYDSERSIDDELATLLGNILEEKEIVICSAIRMPDGEIFRGHRHCHCIQMGYELVTHRHEKFAGPEWHCPYGDDQGFISSKNRYVTREEGMRLQLAAGIESVAEGGYRGSILFSEDLY